MDVEREKDAQTCYHLSELVQGTGLPGRASLVSLSLPLLFEVDDDDGRMGRRGATTVFPSRHLHHGRRCPWRVSRKQSLLRGRDSTSDPGAMSRIHIPTDVVNDFVRGMSLLLSRGRRWKREARDDCVPLDEVTRGCARQFVQGTTEGMAVYHGNTLTVPWESDKKLWESPQAWENPSPWWR